MTSCTWRDLGAALLAAALASCGSVDSPANRTDGIETANDAVVTKFSLTSGFQDGQPIPVQYTCDADNMAPPLDWSGAPKGTKSFALVFDDPDAPSGTFWHWGIYDIPATVYHLGDQKLAAPEAVNDFGEAGYRGPCPPKGLGPHRYRFKLYALDVESLGLSPDTSVEQLEQQAKQHKIGIAQLTGTFERT